jgi:hypothetical protein
VWIDRDLNMGAFAGGVHHVRWLEATATGIRFPHFDRHTGESAKKRALPAERQRLARERTAVATAVTVEGEQASRTERDKSVSSEEKRVTQTRSSPADPDDLTRR